MSNGDGNPPQVGGWVRVLLALAPDGAELLRQELRLARQEAVEKLTPVAQGSGMALAGGLMAVIGSGYIADAIVRLLATRMPHWLASLLFAAGLMAGGAVLMRGGSATIKNISLVPEKTMNSLREDKKWLIRQIRSRVI